MVSFCGGGWFCCVISLLLFVGVCWCAFGLGELINFS